MKTFLKHCFKKQQFTSSLLSKNKWFNKGQIFIENFASPSGLRHKTKPPCKTTQWASSQFPVQLANVANYRKSLIRTAHICQPGGMWLISSKAGAMPNFISGFSQPQRYNKAIHKLLYLHWSWVEVYSKSQAVSIYMNYVWFFFKLLEALLSSLLCMWKFVPERKYQSICTGRIMLLGGPAHWHCRVSP